MNSSEASGNAEKEVEHSHDEISQHDGPGTGYTGDTVTETSYQSPAERSLVLKIGTLFASLAALVYFCAYLDRNSIGNAQVAGMSKTLGLSASQYATAASMFFVGYILLMFPANIILKALPPRFVVGTACVMFGSFVAGLGGTQNYATLVGIRLLVGCAQSMIQGLTMYASMWFRRNEMATVCSVYYSAATISGAFSGFIAYAATRNLTKQSTGLEPWRWVFIIDGVVALVVGLLTLALLPAFPDVLRKKGKKHWLFTKEELDIACQRTASFNTLESGIRWPQVLSALKDPKSWAFVFLQFGVATGIGSVGSFLPTFIHGFGLSPLNTQLFSAVPYAVAFVALISLNYASDRVNQKGWFLIGSLTSAIIGYAILLTDVSYGVKIFATCLITGGLYPSVTLLVTWLSINTTGFTKRGTTWAMAEIGGQCMTIGVTHAYNRPPRQLQGHAVVLGLLCLALLNAVFLRFWLARCNSQKEQIAHEYDARGEAHPHRVRSLEDENDQHQYFRYIL